jgi:hypothetical protein
MNPLMNHTAKEAESEPLCVFIFQKRTFAQWLIQIPEIKGLPFAQTCCQMILNGNRFKQRTGS